MRVFYIPSYSAKLKKRRGTGNSSPAKSAGGKRRLLCRALAGCDVVHINTVFPHSFFLAKKAKRHGIPVVYHAHSTKEDFAIPM